MNPDDVTPSAIPILYEDDRAPQPGDLVSAEIESLDRVIADIDAWCEDDADVQPIDFICELRERLDGLRAYQKQGR